MTENKNRLLSLDALRGFTIIGMIVVNSPGSWSHVFSPLLHAKWHGLTPTDLVFPFFLFIVGVSITLAYGRKRENEGDLRKARGKILWRVVKIFALGVFLNLWPSFDFETIRFAGVLQRIAIVFGACALLFLNTSWRTQLYLGLGILFGYWGMLSVIPVPMDDVNALASESGVVERSHGTEVPVQITRAGEASLAANYEPGTNLAAWVDRILLPGRLWERTWDPEGVFSTFPAIATGIFGMLIGSLLLCIGDPYRRVTWVLTIGFLALVLGLFWSLAFPLNKNLWSSSFVLCSGGWACLSLGACLLFVDILGFRKWTYPGLVFGSNAIVAYALSGMLIVVFYSGFGPLPSISSWFMNTTVDLGMSAKLASLIYALLYLAVLYVPVAILWRRKLFIKL
jgi:predicted acyltransferase